MIKPLNNYIHIKDTFALVDNYLVAQKLLLCSDKLRKLPRILSKGPSQGKPEGRPSQLD